MPREVSLVMRLEASRRYEPPVMQLGDLITRELVGVPPRVAKSVSSIKPMPMPYEADERRYGAEVRDADGDAKISITFAPALGRLVGALLALAALALLFITWRRRAARRAAPAPRQED